jgi:lysyl endopeptidase
MRLRITRLAAWIALALCCATPAFAAIAIDDVRVDLDPLIDSAARSPEQFAVNIPHAVSSSAQGSWSKHGSLSTWVYSARVPSAISISFHALGVILPPSAVLTVSTARTTAKYVARNVIRSGLWGRPLPGDLVYFSLSVNSAEASLVRFQIDSLQAGYRSLGGGVPDHPHYLELKRAAAATSSCTENYECHVTTANQGPSNATVALIIGNLYQCSGTLLNNTSANGTPYILTARHCEGGQLGGGNPDAAATVSVYWDAVTPCGSPLGSLYDTTTISQSGATTALEQQDLWLIQMDVPPAANDAYYAGWDAGGATMSGGYTIHYALGEDQQYVEWSGTDVLEQIPGATLSIAYDSTFWGVVNGLGNIGAGGSGSALFNANNQVVGSASLAQLTAGENTAGSCPVQPPPIPSPSTVTALFTALSGAWTSTADRTSSTGNKTLKSLLDPVSTGQIRLPGIATQPITLTASSTFANTGDLITLTWNAAGATSCSAWGGSPGDDWAGTKAASGSMQITDLIGGTAIYSLNCLIDKQLGAGSAAISWNYVAPYVDFSGASQSPLTLGVTTQMSWQTNVQPCVASGGVSGDGWAGAQPTSGTFVATTTRIGLTPYTITCGTGSRTATSSVYVYGVEPYITLVSSVPQIMAGSSFQLNWFGYGTGAPCIPSGGSASDGWANPNAGFDQNGSTNITESAAGTYTYTISCSGGGETATSSQTVVVTPGPPALSLTAASPQQQIGTSTLALLWSTNVSDCLIDYTTTSGQSQVVVLYGEGATGAISDYESSPGVVTYTMRCGANVTSTTIDWVSNSAPPALSVADTTWVAYLGYPLSWNASAGPCVGSGGAAGDGWAGAKNQAGTQSVSESQPGAYMFTLVCGSGATATTSNVIIQLPTPRIQMYSMPGSSVSTGLPDTTIEWLASVGPCTYVDGSSSNSAGVTVTPTGSATPSPSVAGTYLFTLKCGTGANTLYAATLASVPVNAPTTLSASATSVPVDAPVTIAWGSAGYGLCYASGGDGGPPWSGTLAGTGSGSLIVTSPYAGSVIYGISCGSETASVTVTYDAVPATSPNAATPSVTLSSSDSTETAGQSLSLVWSSKNADSCSATGGSPGDGWTGSLTPSGSMTVTETSAGTVTYSITCAGAPPAATARASVIIVTAAAAAAGSSHGGGSIDPLLLSLLSVLVGVSLARGRPRPVGTALERKLATLEDD